MRSWFVALSSVRCVDPSTRRRSKRLPRSPRPDLRTLPILIVTSDDGFAPDVDVLADEIVRHGGAAAGRIHMATDHAYSDHRIALQKAVVDWLQAQFK